MPGATTSIKIRLAKCLRRQGKNKEAMDLLEEILKKKSMMIDAQIEAAYTYQAWGQEKPGYYLYAIKGGKKNKRTGKYVVWGWGKIARLVASHKQHRDVFHEARYNLAVSRLKLALSQTGKEKKGTLEQAQTDIEIVQRLYPEMGGDEWRGKYDGLLKQIQRLRGEKAVGLKPRAEPTASR